MTALTQDRDTVERTGDLFVFDIAADVLIYAGALVALDTSGNATPGATATTLIGAGRAEEQVDNSGGLAAAKTVNVRRGVFRYANSADADEITKASIGDTCYIVDDATVAKTDGGSTRSKAGIVADVDSLGVWVDFRTDVLNTPAAGLLAANNLSDVGSAATAFGNIKQAASATATGVAELATSAETQTGNDTTRIVTPKGAADTYAQKFGTPTITVGAEAADVINVAIQLTDAAGDDLAVRGAVQAYLSDDANGDSIAGTAPSGGVAIGADGLAIPIVAGKAFTLVSEADGDIDLDITEAAGATWYLILVMPDGRLIASDAITFAA